MPSTSRAVFALTLISALVSVGCSSRDADAPAATTAVRPTSTTAPAATAPAGDANVVIVKTFQFKPTPITVRAGSPVVWQNQDEITHEPTSGRPGEVTSAFAAVTLDGAGSSGSVTIATPGTYPYFCAVHESMHGEIVVT